MADSKPECSVCGRTRLPLVTRARGGTFCPVCYEREGHITNNTLPMRELVGLWAIRGEGKCGYPQIERRLNDGLHPDAVLFPYEVPR
jgi:hypothetical protein